jgi:hypothetical protein
MHRGCLLLADREGRDRPPTHKAARQRVERQTSLVNIALLQRAAVMADPETFTILN